MATTKKIMYNVFPEKETTTTLAAALANRLISTRNASLNESLSDFEGSSHNLEMVTSKQGVDFINDSRSTNVNAVWYALERMTKPVTWIMNIANVEDLTDELLEIVNQKVKRIVFQGVYNPDILDYFAQMNKEVSLSMNLEEAVRIAFYASQAGDVVLFSPGTTSNGMYRTYRERGDKFKDAVAQL